MVRFVTIGKFSEVTGYTEEAVRSKIKRGDWLEGREFLVAPDRRNLMDLEAYEKWVLGQAASEPPPTDQSRSTSTTAGHGAGKG